MGTIHDVNREYTESIDNFPISMATATSVSAFSALNCPLKSRQTLPFSAFFSPPPTTKNRLWLTLRIEAREPTRKESAKVRNRRLHKKFNGTSEKPRLSIFCSGKHLYAELVDDSKKKILAFASTPQESMCGDPPCDTVEAARRVGNQIIKACVEQDITQVSIDCNGFARGEKMKAFEMAIHEHGFLP